MVLTDRLASIGELSSGIAHELNNPLTSVVGLTQLMLENENIAPDLLKDLQMINSEAQRAARIVKNLLVFARKHENEMHPARVENILEKVLELREYEQKVHNINVIRDYAPDLPYVLMDWFQIQQVFLNIVVNAEFAMSEANGGGALTIKTEMVEGMVKISFIDNGRGIDPENIKHLFDPFFTTKVVGRGTGLGLSISHGIISQHHGNIYVKSKLGEGSVFTVELPLVQPKTDE
jgi:two-component system NtrC family sensor kinase